MGIFVTIPPGHGVIFGIILYGIGVLILALIIRVILSWARLDERNGFVRFLAKLTDPFITPIRRFAPRVGFLDTSYIVAFLLLGVLQILLTQALPPYW